MMGIGQVVTLRLPASRLREVNRILETTAWGSYHTEFYPTYDYKAIGLASHDKGQAKIGREKRPIRQIPFMQKARRRTGGPWSHVAEAALSIRDPGTSAEILDRLASHGAKIFR